MHRLGRCFWRGALLTLLCLPMASGAQTVPPAETASAVDAPRQLSEQDLAKLRRSVQNSKVRAQEEARLAELQRQEQARQAEIQRRQMAAQAARQAQEDARADAEFEADRARKAAQFNAQKAASERALANSVQRLDRTANQAQAQQLERQRQQAEAQQRTERQRQVELINQATQRQDQEAARLAAQRQQSEQKRADAQAAERTEAQQRQAAAGAAAVPATTTGATRPIGTLPAANAGGSACRVTQPKLNDTTVTSKGEAGGIAKLRERAASTCKSYTGSEAFSADTQCRADGPYVHHCSLKGQCSGEYRICGPEQ